VGGGGLGVQRAGNRQHARGRIYSEAPAGAVVQRERHAAVGRIGIERAWDRIRSADAVLFLHDLTRQGDAAHRAGDAAIAAGLPPGVPVLQVWNKLDQAGGAPEGPDHIALSARQGTGLEALRQRLLALAGWRHGGDGLFMARERHLQALQRVDDHLQQAAALLAHEAGPLDLLAEEERERAQQEQGEEGHA